MAGVLFVRKRSRTDSEPIMKSNSFATKIDKLEKQPAMRERNSRKMQLRTYFHMRSKLALLFYGRARGGKNEALLRFAEMGKHLLN